MCVPDYSAGSLKIGIESHRQILQGHVAPRKNRERKGPSQGVMHECEPWERIPWAPKFEERTPNETLKQERCARREALYLAKDVHKLKKEEKDTLYSPAEAWVMPALSSKKPEEREFVIDSGASMHMLSKKDLGSGEKDTL